MIADENEVLKYLNNSSSSSSPAPKPAAASDDAATMDTTPGNSGARKRKRIPESASGEVEHNFANDSDAGSNGDSGSSVSVNSGAGQSSATARDGSNDAPSESANSIRDQSFADGGEADADGDCAMDASGIASSPVSVRRSARNAGKTASVLASSLLMLSRPRVGTTSTTPSNGSAKKSTEPDPVQDQACRLRHLPQSRARA